MRATFIGLAASLALATAALAQTAAPPPAKAPSGDLVWYSHQAEEMRASKLIGTKVVNTANETVGDVNEIVLSKDGRVVAIVIGVGGFLGMGEHEVALDFKSVRMSRDQNNRLVLTVNATRELLKAAPQWRWEQARL